MQIKSSSNNISFKSVPLRSVQLKKLTNGVEDGFANAIFSKLDPNNIKDAGALENIKAQWKVKSILLSAFCASFKMFKEKTIHYNAIELLGGGNLEERIVGLIKTTKHLKKNNKFLIIQQMVTKPEFSYSSSAQRQLKGAGEIMLYEIFQNAKQKKFAKISLISTNNSFYEHTFKKAGINIYEEELLDSYNDELTIPRSHFDKYINYCKKEYNLSE